MTQTPVETDDDDVIAPPPRLDIAPGDAPQLQAHTYKGKLIAYSRYVPETSSGGVYLCRGKFWMVRGPISAADCQAFVATALEALAASADAEEKRAN